MHGLTHLDSLSARGSGPESSTRPSTPIGEFALGCAEASEAASQRSPVVVIPNGYETVLFVTGPASRPFWPGGNWFHRLRSVRQWASRSRALKPLANDLSWPTPRCEDKFHL